MSLPQGLSDQSHHFKWQSQEFFITS